MSDIFRMIKNNNYTVMSNHHLQNQNLSLKAMGLMSKVLSLPDDWKYSVKGLAAYCRDGYESVRTGLSELEAEGYLVRRQIRNDRGQILCTEYIFRESPDMEIPELERAAIEAPGTEVIEKQEEPGTEVTEEPGPGTEPLEEKEEAHGTRINTGFLPGSENPIVDKKRAACKEKSMDDRKNSRGRESPGSDFPITENPSLENPSLGNRHLQNTNKLNTNKQNIIKSSSRSFRGEEGKEEAVCRIREQIGYDLLRPKYGQALLDEIVELMAEVSLPGSAAAFYTVNQKRIDRKTMCERLSNLGSEHIRTILEGIRNGPPIRNVRSYLLTSLYQADTALHINAVRNKKAEKKNGFHNFHERSYDFSLLEKSLLQAQDRAQGTGQPAVKRRGKEGP